MADIVIERLQITVELDGAGAEEHFHRMFGACIERWAAAEQARATDRQFAERERLLPQHEGFR